VWTFPRDGVTALIIQFERSNISQGCAAPDIRLHNLLAQGQHIFVFLIFRLSSYRCRPLLSWCWNFTCKIVSSDIITGNKIYQLGSLREWMKIAQRMSVRVNGTGVNIVASSVWLGQVHGASNYWVSLKLNPIHLKATIFTPIPLTHILWYILIVLYRLLITSWPCWIFRCIWQCVNIIVIYVINYNQALLLCKLLWDGVINYTAGDKNDST